MQLFCHRGGQGAYMEIKGKQAIREMIQKIGVTRLIIIILAGIMLLVLSVPPKEKASEENVSVTESMAGQESNTALLAMSQYAKRQEEATEKILSKVEGIGKVEVMITLSSSEQKITLQDDNNSSEEATQSDQSGGSRMEEKHQTEAESVLIKRDGEETPYVVQVQAPVVEGVVVVAQGVDSGKKKTEIIEAIQALFPVESHKIKVMKME